MRATSSPWSAATWTSKLCGMGVPERSLAARGRVGYGAGPPVSPTVRLQRATCPPWAFGGAIKPPGAGRATGRRALVPDCRTGHVRLFVLGIRHGGGDMREDPDGPAHRDQHERRRYPAGGPRTSRGRCMPSRPPWRRAGRAPPAPHDLVEAVARSGTPGGGPPGDAPPRSGAGATSGPAPPTRSTGPWPAAWSTPWRRRGSTAGSRPPPGRRARRHGRTPAWRRGGGARGPTPSRPGGPTRWRLQLDAIGAAEGGGRLTDRGSCRGPLAHRGRGRQRGGRGHRDPRHPAKPARCRSRSHPGRGPPGAEAAGGEHVGADPRVLQGDVAAGQGRVHRLPGGGRGASRPRPRS